MGGAVAGGQVRAPTRLPPLQTLLCQRRPCRGLGRGTGEPRGPGGLRRTAPRELSRRGAEVGVCPEADWRRGFGGGSAWLVLGGDERGQSACRCRQDLPRGEGWARSWRQVCGVAGDSGAVIEEPGPGQDPRRCRQAGQFGAADLRVRGVKQGKHTHRPMSPEAHRKWGGGRAQHMTAEWPVVRRWTLAARACGARLLHGAWGVQTGWTAGGRGGAGGGRVDGAGWAGRSAGGRGGVQRVPVRWLSVRLSLSGTGTSSCTAPRGPSAWQT